MNHYVLKPIEYPKRLSITDIPTKQNSESLESHSLYGHSEDDSRIAKIFPCTFSGCDKQYSSKSRLLIHTRTHVYIINPRLERNLSIAQSVIKPLMRKVTLRSI